MKESDIIVLEKYKGEIRGTFTSVYIVADRNAQIYMTYDLQYEQHTPKDVRVDFESTKWEAISNERHYLITDELSLVSRTVFNNSKVIINNQFPINPQNSNSMEKNKEAQPEARFTGIAFGEPKYQFNEFENGGKKLSFTLTGKDKTHQAVIAYDDQATRIKNSLDSGIIKFEVTGNLKDVKFESKKEPGKMVEYKAIEARDIVEYQMLRVEGKITMHEEKSTKGEHKYTKLLISNPLDEKGQKHQTVNITLWENRKGIVPKTITLEKGHHIAVSGEAAITQSKDGRKSMDITAWNIEKDIPSLLKQIQAFKEAKLQQGQEAPTKTAKTEKSTSKDQTKGKATKKNKEASKSKVAKKVKGRDV